jgi:tetratricopeptide (TPR) repeat protein
VNQGIDQEKKYDWVVAIEPYGKALTIALKRNDFFKAAKTCERIGFCYHRTAMQARNPQEFKNRMLQAFNAYSKAAKLLEKAEDPEKPAKMRQCQAMAAYVNSWLNPDSASRKRRLDECLKLQEENVRFYKRIGDRLGLGQTYNELSTCLVDRLNLEWNKQIRQKALRKALSYGDKAIDILSELGEKYGLAEAYYTTSIHCHTAARGLELEKKKK